MNKSLDSLRIEVAQLDNMDVIAQTLILRSLYHEHNMSWEEIAGLIDGYYTVKLRRLATKLGIKSRDRSAAQSNAIKSNRHPHPTKDKGHKEAAKLKISEEVSARYENLSVEEKRKISEQAKERWNQKSPEELRDMREAANDGTRLAAKEGSKLEKYLLLQLIKNGYKAQFHKEHFVIREKLQVDIFVPELNVAIEVDGPTHFADIWGKEALTKSQVRDNQKTGLLLQKGCVVIRIKQDRHFSDKHKRTVCGRLLDKLTEIKANFPPKGQRHLTIGVD